MTQSCVDILPSVEKVIEPVIKSNTVETVTTTTTVTTVESSGADEPVQIIETQETETKVAPEPEPTSNAEDVDTSKLIEPENSEMTGKNRISI